MRARHFLALSLVLCFGCPANVAPNATKPPTTGKATASKAPGKPGDPAPAGDLANGPAAATEQLRVLAPGTLTAKTKLMGEVRLISDKGAGLISNNGGALVSNNGGAIVANNGSGLVSNNGSAYTLRQAAAPAEARLVDAEIDVLDAANRRLANPDGTPIAVTTDAQGRYRLEADLPAENLVLRVRLYNGGTLRGLLARGGEGERTLDLDTAASVGASFVLDRLVKGDAASYQKLGAADVDALHRDLRASLRHLPAEATSYAPTALAAAADAIRKADPAVDTTLKRIEAILVAGQKDLGDGRPATEVALGSPVAAQYNAAGELVIAESYGRRIRVVGADGRIRTLVGARVRGADAIKAELGVMGDMALAADGAIYVTEPFAARVRRIAPDGEVTVVAGAEAPGGTALTRPVSLALAPDGSFYVGEQPGYPSSDGARGRIFHVLANGTHEEVPLPAAMGANAQVSGLSVAPDGTLYATATNTQIVARKKPGAEWEAKELFIHRYAKRIAVDAQGRAIVTEVFGRRVLRYDFAKDPEVLAGTGDKGYDGDGGPGPASRWISCASAFVAADGRVVVADAQAGVVRAIATDGVVRTVAGAAGARVAGDVYEVAINQPTGIAIDGQGRVLISEIAAHTVKRVENGRLEIVAGGGAERGVSGTRPLDLYLDHPTGLTVDGATLYFSDTISGVVRRVNPDGLSEIVAGQIAKAGLFNLVTARSGKATEMAFARPTSLVVGPDKALYFSDSINNLIVRVKPDGMAEIVAGLPAVGSKPREGRAAEGALAAESPLKAPTGLVFDKAGNLYVAEAGNYRVSKIDPQGRITTFAGTTMEAALPRFGAGQPLVKTGDKATDAFLAGPSGLAFDAAGNLYVAVMGTTNLQLLGDFLPLATDVPVTVHPALVRVGTDATVTVLAGPGGLTLSDPEAEDALALPFGVAVDKDGRVLVVDSGQNQVRAISTGAP